MEEIKSMINKIGRNITKTSKDIIKNTKLSMQLSSQEEKLKNIYIEVGKKVYEIYSYGGNIGEFFDDKYKEMVSIEKEISIIKQKIAENKENKEDNIKYIQNENKDININRDIIDMRTETLYMEEDKICNACGQKNKINDKFCVKCGRTL